MFIIVTMTSPNDNWSRQAWISDTALLVMNALSIRADDVEIGFCASSHNRGISAMFISLSSNKVHLLIIFPESEPTSPGTIQTHIVKCHSFRQYITTS